MGLIFPHEKRKNADIRGEKEISPGFEKDYNILMQRGQKKFIVLRA